ncbi:hypothetical protein A2U01_0074785, partial [Trifolium medium]|nr:hypothetical protein [Trifolium medium]
WLSGVLEDYERRDKDGCFADMGALECRGVGLRRTGALDNRCDKKSCFTTLRYLFTCF